MIFSDNRILNGWKESSLSNCGTQELSNCNLSLQTLLLQSVHQVNNMWIIVQGAAFVNLRNENDKIDSGISYYQKLGSFKLYSNHVIYAWLCSKRIKAPVRSFQ
jgi:hypothetical protein